jgi:hypothetical protein
MKLDELRFYLDGHGFRPDAVSIGVGLPYESERYCIVEESGHWQVYYSERGSKGGLKEFGTEDDACRYILDLLRKDSSVWLNRASAESPLEYP